MIKKIYYKIKYIYYFITQTKTISYLLSLKNSIFHPNEIIGIYDLKNRDLSYDICEFLIYLTVKKKILKKKKIIINIYSAEKFKKEKQFYSFFLRIVKQFDVDFKLKNKSFFTKYNNFCFNTFFLDNTVNDGKFNEWDKFNHTIFSGTNFLINNNYYQKLFNNWLIENKINKEKLITLSVRNNPYDQKNNTNMNLLNEIYNYIKKNNYFPVIINDNLNPCDIKDKYVLKIKGNNMLYRAQFYKNAILNICSSRGAGNLIITEPTNWLIYNFEEGGRKRFNFFKKIGEFNGRFCHIDNNYNNFKNLENSLSKFFRLKK